MSKRGQYATACGDFERACRAAFKTLERSPGPSAVESLDAVAIASGRVLVALVAEMRAAGGTWADVGDAFGISRQAAFKRFG